ncbi:hypothetical protein [Spirosoma lituiforme]
MKIPVKQLRDYHIVNSTTELTAYTGSRTGMLLPDGRSYYYDSASSATIDNAIVLAATGKGGGRWISNLLHRVDLARFGVKTGTSLSASQITANTSAFQSAINSGERLSLPSNVDIVIDGLLTTNNIPVNIIGSTISSKIRQKTAVGVFDCAVNLENFWMENVNVFPEVDTPNSFAIKITGAGGNNPNVQLKNVVVNRGVTANNVTNLFGGGFWLVNFGEGLIEHCKYFGMDQTKSVGMKLTNTVISVSSTIHDFKVYGALTGLDVNNSTYPGIEGIRITESDFVTCSTGINVSSATNLGTDGNYHPPQFEIIGCHFNVSTAAVKMRQYCQFNISDPLVYLSNATDSTAFDIDYCQDVTVQNARVFSVGSGPTTGIIIGANCNNIKWINNYSKQKAGESQCIVKPGATGIEARNNRIEGGTTCINDSAGLAIKASNYVGSEREVEYKAMYSTSNWSTSNYYNVIPGGTLVPGAVYLVQLSFSQSGLDDINQAYIVPITNTYTSANAMLINGNYVTYSGTARYFTIRYRPGATSNTAVGLEVSPSVSGLSSTLVVTATKLS